MELRPEISPAILDYASPSNRASLRLTAKSIVRMQPTAKGFEIVETLQGQAGAVVAIVFSSCTVGGLDCLTLADMLSTLWSAEPAFIALSFAVPVVLTILTVSLIPKVIDSTWRKTVVEIHSGGMSLIFSSPLTKSRHEWESSQIRQASVVVLEGAVHEVQIDIWNYPLVRLFTGHSFTELNEIGSKMNRLWSSTPSNDWTGETS